MRFFSLSAIIYIRIIDEIQRDVLVLQGANDFVYLPHPRPSVTIDIVLFQIVQDICQILLIKRAQEPFLGSFALPGGFIIMDETLEEGAIRELKEETGLDNIQLIQIHTFSKPDRDPRGRVITTAFSAVLDPDIKVQLKPGDDASEAGWFKLSKLPLLAFDHKDIIQTAATKMNLENSSG